MTAEAKDPEEDFLSGLVRAVGTVVEASSSEDKDYISDLVGTVRRKGDNREDETDGNVSTGALRFITYAYSKPSYTPPRCLMRRNRHMASAIPFSVPNGGESPPVSDTGRGSNAYTKG